MLRELAANGNGAGVKDVGVALVGVEGDVHAAVVSSNVHAQDIEE